MKKETTYQFKVSLRHIRPLIWRRIQVPSSYTFWDLHVALQDAMGWLDCHLHMFCIQDPDSSDIKEIGIPNDEPFEDEAPCLAGWNVPISDYFTEPGARADYKYDFGDGWEHEVVLEKTLAIPDRTECPACLEGERTCPPEDCGGLPGYERLLQIVRDPSHEEYEGTMEWLGGAYAPNDFDPRRIRFDDPQERWETAFSND